MSGAVSGERYLRARELFESLCDAPAERVAESIARLRESDPELARELSRMLDADQEQSEAFLDRPILASEAAVEPDEVPRSIGPYRVVGRLGAGSAGVVVEAEQDVPRRKVAIKALNAAVRGHASLYDEVQAIGRLLHRAIPQVYELCVHEGTPYLVMERVEGVRLTEWARERPRRRRLELMVEICDGVHAAHAHGVIHRDLKPSNILVTAAGQPKILDFGLASPRAAKGGTIVGTPAYMSPEALRGDAEAARETTDVYALGILLLELLSGRTPVDEREISSLESLAEVRVAGIDLRGYRRWLDADLGAIVARCLAPDPDDRYPDAESLGEDLRRHLEWVPISVRRATPAYRLRCWVLRHRAALVGAMLAVLVVVGAIGAVQLWREHDAARRLAELEASAERQRQRVKQRIEELLGGDEPDVVSADAVFFTFASLPDVAGTAALAEAWLDRAQRQRRLGRAQPELDALARAYVETDREPLLRRAGLGISQWFVRRWRWDRALHVLEALGDTDDPAVRAHRVDALAGMRMLGEAATLAPPDDPRRPMLEALASATRSDHQAYASAFVRIDGIETVLLADHRHRRFVATERAATLPIRATLELGESVGWGHDLPAILPRSIPAMLSTDPEDRRLVVSDLSISGERLVARERMTREHVFVMDWLVAAIGEADEAVYLGGGLDDRGLFAWRPEAPGLRPHPATDAARSDVNVLWADDLDGDGAQELIAAVGPWDAYDIRLFEGREDGRLELVDRLEVGNVEAIATLPRRGGPPLLVVGESDRLEISDFRGTEGPAGLHLIDASGGRLDVQRTIALPEYADIEEVELVRIVVGDLDGDGRSDLSVALRTSVGESAWFVRQDADGEFTSVLVDGLAPLGAGPLDDDAADELIVRVPDDEHHTWVLGAGPQALPPRPRFAPRRPPEISDELRESSRRLESMIALGLDEQAVDLAEALATSAEPPQAAELLRWAAELQASRGDVDDAGRLYLSASGRAGPAQVVRLLREAALLQSDMLDLSGLVQTLAELRTHGEEAFAEDLLGRLGLEAGATPSLLHAREALQSRWSIGAPESFLSGDERSDALGVDMHVGQPALLEIPLRWDADVLSLELEVERERIEVGAELHVELVPEGADSGLSLSFGVRGRNGDDGRDAIRAVRCGTRLSSERHMLRGVDLDERERVVLRVGYSATDGLARCTGRSGEAVLFSAKLGLQRPLAGSRWRLRVFPTPYDRPNGAGARLRIHRLALWGMSPREVPSTPRLQGHRALIAHDFEEARRRYREAGAEDYEILAMIEGGDTRAASARLEALGSSELPLPLVTLHRFRPEVLSPLVRAWAGEDYPERLSRNWGSSLSRIDREAVRRELLHPGMDGIEGSTLERVHLLQRRARQFESRGQLGRARREYAKVARSSASGEGAQLLMQEARVRLAMLCASSGALEEARRWAIEAVASSPTPRMTRDRLVRVPGLGSVFEAEGR